MTIEEFILIQKMVNLEKAFVELQDAIGGDAPSMLSIHRYDGTPTTFDVSLNTDDGSFNSSACSSLREAVEQVVKEALATTI